MVASSKTKTQTVGSSVKLESTNLNGTTSKIQQTSKYRLEGNGAPKVTNEIKTGDFILSSPCIFY
jgi:hypothetical protein